MFTKTLIALVAAASAVTASPVPAADASNASNAREYSSLALRSASPIHFRELSANNGHIFIGKKTKSFCPDGVQCPAGKKTVFEQNISSGTIAMDVVVPGGQRLYVAKNGALSYTAAHTGGAIPDGGKANGFTFSPSQGGSIATWNHEKGLVACPQGDDVFKVFVALDGVNIDHCLGFDGLVTKANGAGAWQYD